MSNLGWFQTSDKLGAPDLWTPANELPVLWLNPDSPNSVIVDGKFSSITNEGTLSAVFSQGTVTKRPAVQYYNNRKIAYFDGVDDHLTAAGLTLHSGSWSIFAVAQASANNNGGTEAGRRTILCQDYTALRIAQYLKTDGGTIHSIAFSSTAAVYDSYVTQDVLSPFIVHAFATAGNSGMQFFGGAASMLLTTSSIASGSQECVFGARKANSADVSEEFYGGIFEVILYNYVVSNNLAQKIEGYLAHKWGLAKEASTLSVASVSAPAEQLMFVDGSHLQDDDGDIKYVL